MNLKNDIMDTIKIAVVDDQPVFCDTLEVFLNSVNDFQVMMIAHSGRDVLHQLDESETLPDIILLDIDMPNLNGTETLPIIVDKYPNIKVIMLSLHSGLIVVKEHIDRGASGYLCKGGASREIFESIRQVHKQGFYLPERVALELRASKPSSNGLVILKEGDNALLNDKEKKVLKLICKGNSNKLIADTLNVTVKSVEYHRSNLFKKTNSKNVVELVYYAIENMLDV